MPALATFRCLAFVVALFSILGGLTLPGVSSSTNEEDVASSTIALDATTNPTSTPSTSPSSYADLSLATFNELIYTSDFVREITSIVDSPENFLIFKTKAFPTVYRVLSEFLESPVLLFRTVDCLLSYAPHLFTQLPELSRRDNAVGSPITHEYYVGLLTSSRQEPPQSGLSTIHVNMRSGTHPPRFLYQLMSVEYAFRAVNTLGFKDFAVLEIGGGAGGMLTTFLTVHDLKSYTIVDLSCVHKLVRKVLRASNDTRSDEKLIQLTPDSTLPVSSDLFLSFWCLSEQTREQIDAYLELYVANAKRGYIQLNYDEDLEGGGNSALGDMNVGRDNVLQLFSKIVRLQPSAVLLPQPPCGKLPFEHCLIMVL